MELLIGAHDTRDTKDSKDAKDLKGSIDSTIFLIFSRSHSRRCRRILICNNVSMYNCTAIFAKGDQSILDAARQKWKGCLARSVDKPFQGVAFADPGADRCYPLVFNSAQSDEHEKIAQSMKDDLLSWSERFPSTIFVFIEVDCFGGVCEFEGFVVHNGINLCRHEGKDALKKLVAYLDVPMEDTQMFEPFTRGFFHICRDEKKY